MILLTTDPGLTTGWALLDEIGSIIDTGNCTPEEVGPTLRRTILEWHRRGHMIRGAIEKFPLAPNGKLANELRSVVLSIEAIFLGSGINVTRVTPGVWKTSSIPETQKTWADKTLTPHQRDAIRMGRYVLRARNR